MPHAVPHSPTRVTYAIGKVEVPVVSRFAEGTVLTAEAAAALNQLIQENTRNNLYARWKREDEQGLEKHKGFASRAEEAVAYQSAYVFGGRKSGRPASATHDPVRAEAFTIMVRMIKNQLQTMGKPIKGKTELIHKQANALLDATEFTTVRMQETIEAVWASAREYAAKLQEVGSDTLDGLDFGSDTQDEPHAEAADH